MRKLLVFAVLFLSLFFFTPSALAAIDCSQCKGQPGSTECTFNGKTTTCQLSVGVIQEQQGQGVPASTTPSTVLSNAITIIFVIATLVVLFFLVIGAFNWITSGGDKEKIQKARGTIVNALIGLAILALAFLLVNVVTQILGLQSITQLKLPTLYQQ